MSSPAVYILKSIAKIIQNSIFLTAAEVKMSSPAVNVLKSIAKIILNSIFLTAAEVKNELSSSKC